MIPVGFPSNRFYGNVPLGDRGPNSRTVIVCGHTATAGCYA